MGDDRLPARAERVAVLRHLAAQVVVPLERHHAALQLPLAPRRTLLDHHGANSWEKEQCIKNRRKRANQLDSFAK